MYSRVKTNFGLATGQTESRTGESVTFLPPNRLVIRWSTSRDYAARRRAPKESSFALRLVTPIRSVVFPAASIISATLSKPWHPHYKEHHFRYPTASTITGAPWSRCSLWWRWRESNPRPESFKSSRITAITALLQYLYSIQYVYSDWIEFRLVNRAAISHFLNPLLPSVGSTP